MSEQNDNKTPAEQETYQEPFPYKTYDEILSEKEHKDRVQRTTLVIVGIFLVIFTFFAGISVIWTNTGDLFQEIALSRAFKKEQTQQNQDSTAPQGTDQNFQLQLPDTLPDAPSGTKPVTVLDVTQAVKSARSSVVSIEAEDYGDLSVSKSCSGIILSEKGYILTNSAAVSGCDTINVTLDDGQSYSAFIIGDDAYSGLAIIKIDASGLAAAQLGDSDLLEIGQPAVAMGSFSGSMQGMATTGVISGISRNILIENRLTDLIQTNAQVNAGNTGGPLLNEKGEVVGICTRSISLDGYEGMGFAIPINTVRPIAEELIRSGTVSGRPLLGIQCSKVSSIASTYYNMPTGLYVLAVTKGSSAEKAGLMVGDVITHIGEMPVTQLSSAFVLRNQYHAGDPITLTYRRKGKDYTVTVPLMDQRDGDPIANF